MNQIDFIKLVSEIRNNCGLDCFGPTYYVFIHKGLKMATVNKTGYCCMDNIEYVIVVCAYRWENLGYTNASLTQLLMVDHDFNPVEYIPFGNWAFKELGFTTRPNDWYNKYMPYPHLELISDPSVNNYKPKTMEEHEKAPKWNSKCQDIEDFNTFLNDIHEFSRLNPL
ncbi:MAG: hypothetical protein HDR83_02175 [Bacteroides sp.]|nr:hypothetical protein [Bacteroides sp.]MBD5368057.1 hypothetical protein [Bacteroides sp.]